MNSTWLIAFIFLAVLPISISQPPATSLDKPDPDATSLVPSNRHDTLLVATLDGTISLIEISSQRILWSFKSGRPIYSSYQAPVNLDSSQNASEPRDDSYIDCGEDWHLYKHDRAKGTVERLNCTCGEFITIARNLSTDGTTLLVQQTTTYFVVDAKTGTVMRIMMPSDPPGLGFEGGGNPVMVWDESKEQLYITRTDYMFSARSKLSGKFLWKLTFAEIEAEFSCQEVESSTVDNASHSLNQLLSDYKSDFRSSSYCQRHTTVYRIRDHSYSEIMSETRLVDGVPKSLTGDRLLPLPAADPSYVPMLVGGNHGAHYDDKGGEIRVHSEKMLSLSSVENNDPASHTEVLALPFPEVSSDVTRQNSNLTFPYHVWLPIVFVFFFLFMVGFIIRRCFLMVPQNKQMEDSTSKVAIAKKKRTRKSGINRNNTSANNIKGITLNGNNDGGAVGVLDCESIDKKLHLTFTGLLDTKMDGRRIGKLFVSSNEIAKGSNGTVVLEGVYDGRPVAVKRLVQTHTDVALKEIQNLIASDQHPNIVRLYGAEFDSDFVYLSLERCMCSLNDMIHFYAESSHIEGRAQKMDFNPMNEYILQLHGKVGGKIDFELWKADGYPSSPLLKLMRDVVSGLAHLHELGIIHRDLKPQNVLIIKEKSLCAKLSDMGISKRLVGDMSALTQHATGGGSSGWRAPEQLLHGRQTRAVDLFSLGCVLFFCISGGKHPFGGCFERDSNIVKNQKDLFLVDHIAEAVDLISHLLDPDPQLRPKASEALLHPLFWNSETRLSFLRDASDRVELEDREVDSDLLKALEATAPVALGGKWDEKLENSFLTNIGRYRRYKYDSVRDLLRVIRNKLNHYRELPKDIQEVLGSVPEGFDYYFMSRFPKLLIEVYRVIEKYCREEELLSKYFKSSLI